MIKVNGQIRLQRDDVGELVPSSKKFKNEVNEKCREFFRSRGMIEDFDMRDIMHGQAVARQHEKKRRKKWEDEEFDYESEQDAAENWI